MYESCRVVSWVAIPEEEHICVYGRYAKAELTWSHDMSAAIAGSASLALAVGQLGIRQLGLTKVHRLRRALPKRSASAIPRQSLSAVRGGIIWRL